MALVEREHELARLEAVIAEAGSGRGSTVLIEGLPGIGKTALLDEAREIAGESGLRVLSASAAALETDLGFAVVRDMFEPALAAVHADEQALILTGAARLATGPLGLDQGADATPVELGSAIHGIYWLCANLADRGPMLLAVDDLHWGDTPSLLFLTYLARRVTEHPIVICATTRPSEQEPAEQYLTALLAEAGDVLHPESLTTQGVARVVEDILASGPAPEFSEACAHTTGGNPFLLVETLGALRKDGVEPSAAAAANLGELRPETLTRSLLARIARLGPEAKSVASAVAVLGAEADLRLISELAEVDHDTAAEAITGLRREGILTPDSPTAFVHPLIRTAAYADIPEPTRGLAHLRVARLLDGDGHDADRVAPHLLVAEKTADPWVVERLRVAANTALVKGTPGTAAALLDRALLEPAADTDRPTLLLELGQALARSGDLGAGIETLDRALRLVHEPEARVAPALELGRTLRLAGRLDESLEILDDAVQNLPPGHHDERTTLEVEVAMSSHFGLPAKQWVDRLAAAAEQSTSDSLPDRSVRIFYAYIAASTASQPAEEVARLARSGLPPAGLADPPLLLQLAGASLALSGAAVEALDVLDAALETTRVLGDPVQFGFVSLTRSWMAYRAGRIAEHETDARSGVTIAADGALDLPWAVAALANALFERGSPQEAQALMAEHGLDETREPDTAASTSLYCIRSRVHLVQGRQQKALADIERCRDLLTQTGLMGSAFVEWRTDMTLTLLAIGDRELARDVAAEDLTISRQFGAPREIGMALRTSGLAEGGDAGLDLLADSVDVLAPSEAELEHAKSLVELGAALRRAGRRSDAQDRLRLGLDLASRCGSLATVARARDELLAAGARPRRERLTGPDSLTASELRVARLAAEGRSNPEIAQALFVTRRTVEVHLTHVYRKLDIESREQLAAALAPADL